MKVGTGTLAYKIEGLPYNEDFPYLITCAHNFVYKNAFTDEITYPISVIF